MLCYCTHSMDNMQIHNKEIQQLHSTCTTAPETSHLTGGSISTMGALTASCMGY